MNDDRPTRIRQRTYLIWKRENGADGRHLEHWLRAGAETEAARPRSTGQAEQPPAGQPAPGVAESAGAEATPRATRRAG